MNDQPFADSTVLTSTSDTLTICEYFATAASAMLKRQRGKQRKWLWWSPAASSLAKVLEVAAGVGAIDQILQAQIGIPGAAIIEVVATLVALRLQHGEAIERVNRKLDAILAQHLLAGLASFKEATQLGDRPEHQKRFLDAATHVHGALASIEAQYQSQVLALQQYRSLDFVFRAIYALCAQLSNDYDAAAYRLRKANTSLDNLIAECEAEIVTLEKQAARA